MSEVEDGMGFSGLAPTAAERHNDAYEGTRRKIAQAREEQLASAVADNKRLRAALEEIALLDEADGHELTAQHALKAVAIATSTLGKHPSQIVAERERLNIHQGGDKP